MPLQSPMAPSASITRKQRPPIRSTGLVGSANLDNRSFRLNFEVSALFYAEGAVAELSRLFDQDKHKCRHITLKSRSRIAFPSRLAEASARLLSPLL